MKQYDIATFSLPEGEALYDTLDELANQADLLTNKQTKDNIILNMENIRATEETNESMLTPLERHLWNQFLNGTEGAGNGNE